PPDVQRGRGGWRAVGRWQLPESRCHPLVHGLPERARPLGTAHASRARGRHQNGRPPRDSGGEGAARASGRVRAFGLNDRSEARGRRRGGGADEAPRPAVKDGIVPARIAALIVPPRGNAAAQSRTPGSDGRGSIGPAAARCSDGVGRRERLYAVFTSVTCEKACGKLPTWRPWRTSYSSANSPTSFRSARSRSNSERASSTRPIITYTSASQKLQARKAPSPGGRPSSDRDVS